MAPAEIQKGFKKKKKKDALFESDLLTSLTGQYVNNNNCVINSKLHYTLFYKYCIFICIDCETPKKSSKLGSYFSPSLQNESCVPGKLSPSS